MKKKSVFIATIGFICLLGLFGLPYDQGNETDHFYLSSLEFFQIASAYARTCPNTNCTGPNSCNYSGGKKCKLTSTPSCEVQFCTGFE